MDQDTDGINSMEQSHLQYSLRVRYSFPTNEDTVKERLRLSRELNELPRSIAITNSEYYIYSEYHKQRVHTFSREHARQYISHASYVHAYVFA